MLKRTIFSYIVPVAAVAAFIGGGVGLAGRNTSSFNGDGYVLTAADESANGGVVETVGAAEPTSVYFSAGTKYRVQYPSTAVFKDIEGSKQKINFDSFIHYGDDSISALTSGVLVNMDDLGTGVVNHYGTDANVVLVSDGDGYYVENNGNQVSFTNFMWKLSDTRFLLSSPSLALTLPDGSSQKVSGYVEAEYVEDGVIRLTSHDASWMVVADGTAAEFSDGISYDFGDKIVKDSAGNNRMTFQELLLDADDNIKVQSAEEWVAPEFDFSVEDGKDGAAGEAGAAGAAGAAGETGAAGAEGEEGLEGKAGAMGEEGESGSDGRTGTSGSNGKGGDSGTNGGNGNNGNNGKLFDTETKYQAYFNITEYEMDAGSLSVTFTVTDEDAVLSPESGKIVLQDPNGSAVEWTSPDGSLVYTQDANITFDGDATYKVQWNNLNPDTQYRLVISSGYELQNGNGTRDYINRTFYTDSTGLQLDKIEAADDGFTMKVTKKSFSTSSSMRVVISNSSGQDLLYKTISSSDFNDGKLELDSTLFDLADGSGMTNTALKSNTSYTIRLDNMVGSQAIPTGNTQTWKTLKKTPVIKSSKPTGYAVESQYFSLYLDDVEDNDNAIQGYRFEIYTPGGTKPVRTINSTKRTDVAAYVDDANSTLPDDQKLQRGVKYQVKVVVIYYDNEKTAEIESAMSDQFIMSDAGGISVVFQRDTTDTSGDQTKLKGDVIINPGNYKIAVTERYPMEIRVDGINFYKDYETVKNISDLIRSADTGSYIYNLNLQGLKADSSYTISVWGYIEETPGSDSYIYRNLGSYVATTTALDTVQLEMAAAGNGSALGAYIYLGPANDETDPNTYSTTLKSIKAVEVKLYLGATANDDDSNMVGEPAIAVADTSQPGVPYTNVIASTYYGKKGREQNRIYFDESTFGMTSASLTASQYCVKVSAIYDYTKYYPYDNGENLSGYANEIPVSKSSITSLTMNVTNRLPDFPNPQNNGVTATPIKYGDLNNLGITYRGSNADKYQEDTIVGYRLQANYDNTGDLAKSVTYYAVTQADLNAYDADTSANRADDVTLWREAHTERTTPWMKLTYPVKKGSLAPSAIQVLFFDQRDVTSADASVEAITENLTNTEIANNQNADNGIAPKYINGSIPTFFATKLGRGWHYVFAYKTRLEYQGSTEYVYPNGYTGRFVAGQTLLNSGIQDAPKQQTTLEMSLKNNGLDDATNSTGWAEWSYSYTDIDGSIPNEGGLFSAWDARSTGSSSILNAAHTRDTESTGTVGVTTKGSFTYLINKRQLLYNAGDRFSDTDTKDPEVTEYNLVNHVYTRLIDTDVLEDKQMLLAVPASNAGNIATFSFNFSTDIAKEMTSRLTLLKITAYDATTKRQVEGSTQSYEKFDGTDVNGHPYVTYDLSKAGKQGSTVIFKATIDYDTGKMGSERYAADKTYAIQNAANGRYILWKYVSVGNNMYPLNQNSYDYAGHNEYTVTETTPTSQTEADAAWKIKNHFNQLPTGATEENYPTPVMNLKKTESGLMEVDNRGMYPILKEVGSKELTLKDTTDTTRDQVVTIPSLTPSVSNWWANAGLTTINTTFTTNSYEMIKETTPDGMTEAGHYIHVRVTQVDSSKNEIEGTTQDHYIKLNDQDTARSYSDAFTGLASGEQYKVELYCVQAGTGDGNQEILIWNTSSGSQGSAAQMYVTLYSGMQIKNAAVTSVRYNSYEDKEMDLTYSMDLATGFDIQYSIYKKAQSSEQDTPILGPDATMDLMGYKRNDDGIWVRKNNPDVHWDMKLNMTETLTFTPGCAVLPGGDYVLRIWALDQAQAVLGTADVDFTWSPLSAPSFYVETTALSNGTALNVKFNPVDPYKTIAGGRYYVAVWDENNNLKDLYGVGENPVNDPKLIVPNSGVEDSPQTISVTGLEAGKSYKISFYGTTDLSNTGKTALDLGSTVEAAKAQLSGMTAAQLKDITLYETTQATLQSWGGRYSRTSFGFNSSRSLMIYFFEASGLDKITKIEVSVYSGVEGKSWTYTVTRPENGSLFSLVTGSTVNYQAVIPTTLTTSGSYQITRANFYTETSGTEPAFYLTGDAVMP